METGRRSSLYEVDRISVLSVTSGKSRSRLD
jgi:hypothetical protein